MRKQGWFAAMTMAVLVNMILSPVGYSEGQQKLLLHWDFENVTSNIVRDVSGNNNHGTIRGVALADGPNGKCAVLNGKKGLISCADNDLLNPPYITIEFLLCPLAWADTANAILDKGWSKGWGIDPHFYGPEIHFCAYIGGVRYDLGRRGAKGEPDLKINEWAHVAITYDGANICIYKNGHILQQTKKDTGPYGDAKDGKPLSSVLDSANEILKVGGLSEVVVKIDEIKIHAGALTSNEVLNACKDDSFDEFNGKKLIINGCKYITNSKPLFEIHTATNSTEITAYAADELKTYLDKIFACKVNICATNGPADTNKPALAVISYETAREWNIAAGPAHPDGYEIQRKGAVIYIIGHDSSLTKNVYDFRGMGPAGTLFGVYRLLEDLGVCWFFPGDEYEVLPEENTINMTIDKMADHPYFVYRNANTPPLVDQKWMRRIGFGAAVYPASIEHSFAQWPKQYKKTHSAYLNLLDNNQRGDDLCYFNPQVQEQILKDARKSFDARDTGIYPDFTILQNDGIQPPCRCKLCQKHVVYEQGFYGQMSDSLSETGIQLAKEIKTSHPDRRVLIGAYNNSLLPPVRLKEQFPNNMSVQIAKQRMLLWDERIKKRVYDDIIQGWMKFKPATVSFWEYYNFDCWGGEKWQGVPGVSFRLIRDDIKKLHDMSEESKIPILGEVIKTNGRSHEFARERLYWMLPNLYVTAKMLWHPERDLNELLDRFYSVYFGKAGPAMKEFYGTLETAWSSGKWGKNYYGEPGVTLNSKPYSPVPGVTLKPELELPDNWTGNSPWDRLFAPSLIKKLQKNLSVAKGLAKVQPYKRRLELIEYGFKYTVYQYMQYGSDSPGKLSGEAQAVVKMRNKKRYFWGIYLLIAATAFAATTHYVSLSGTNNSPYLNWADAATDVTWAVSASTVNDTVLVTNGTYWPTQRIYNASAITLQSVNGRDVTIINGVNNTNYCMLLGGSSVLDGFTITNGNNNKNGLTGLLVSTVKNCLFIRMTMNNGILGGCTFVSNCVFKNNTGSYLSGGIYSAAGASGVTIVNCLFEGNSAANYGGACDLRSNNNLVSNCTFIANTAAGSLGGGALLFYSTTNCLVTDCVFTSNTCSSATSDGGGICSLGKNVTIKKSTFIKNIPKNRGGALFGDNVTIQNCLFAQNQTTNIGGAIWMTNGIVENCTIVSNYAGASGGGLYIKSPVTGTNNIIYFNTAPNAANFTNTTGNTGLNYCCVFPAVDGTGNITNNPALKNLAGGDYHLNNNSPCINRGINQGWMTGVLDLDGRTRIRYGTVDMGAYERINYGATYGFH